MAQSLVFTHNPAAELQSAITALNPKGVFILCDTNTHVIALSLKNQCQSLAEALIITIPSGDDNKSLSSLSHLWQSLSANGATRHSLLVNIGGGMVTDLGGFAAATFKRGMRFINLPTTLLGAVDAAVGGKTGINFSGLKNEIGAFAEADTVIISTTCFPTLPHEELLSGYAEMLKHALISDDESLNRALAFDFSSVDYDALLPLLQESVQVKRDIVLHDPFEHGLRRALNLGHTIAHAIESLCIERNTPVPHGHAVAWGLVIDLTLSHMLFGFPADILRRVAAFVERNYPQMPVGCADYDTMIRFMRHDKKNADSQSINFTLLAAPGDIKIDSTVATSDITTALDLARDLLHL